MMRLSKFAGFAERPCGGYASCNRWPEVIAALRWILDSWRQPAGSEAEWEQSEK